MELSELLVSTVRIMSMIAASATNMLPSCRAYLPVVIVIDVTRPIRLRGHFRGINCHHTLHSVLELLIC